MMLGFVYRLVSRYVDKMIILALFLASFIAPLLLLREAANSRWRVQVSKLSIPKAVDRSILSTAYMVNGIDTYDWSEESSPPPEGPVSVTLCKDDAETNVTDEDTDQKDILQALLDKENIEGNWRSEIKYLADLHEFFKERARLNISDFEKSEARKHEELFGSCKALISLDHHIVNRAIQRNFSLDDDDDRDSFVNLHRKREELADSCKALIALERHVLNRVVLRNFSMMNNDERDNFVNLHRYGYDIDSKACRDSPDVVVLVHSKFDNFVRRNKVRLTWGFNKTIDDVVFSTVFILGRPNPLDVKPTNAMANISSQAEQKKAKKVDQESIILAEAKAYEDIVMGNFTDTYRNLTIKHIMALDWVLSHCPSVKYIVKMDDDVILNTYNLARYIKGADARNSGLMMCDMAPYRRPVRSKYRKWYTSSQEYPFPIYTRWCLGYGVIMTRDVVQQLYDHSRDVRPFWIDDVYVTGFLAWRAGIKHTPLVGINSTVRGSYRGRFHLRHRFAMFIWNKFKVDESYRAYWAQMVEAQEKEKAGKIQAEPALNKT